MKVYLLLGSNSGERAAALSRAVKLIGERAGAVLSQSSLYETAPWGNTQQPAFLNRALMIETSLPPENLLETLKSIEREMGRTDTVKWGQRLIDIDILLADEVVHQSDTLTIPHAWLAQRRFSLAPLAEIAPGVLHPVLKKSISALLDACPDELEVKKIPEAAGLHS